jgi:hypothetical protein
VKTPPIACLRVLNTIGASAIVDPEPICEVDFLVVCNAAYFSHSIGRKRASAGRRERSHDSTVIAE